MKKSWNKSLHNLKTARSALIDELLLFRRFGLKTQVALGRLAAFSGISRRRAYAIVFNECLAPMADNDRQHIELGAIAAKRWLADYLHAWAHELHRQADLQEIRERKKECGASDYSPTLSGASVMSSSDCPSKISGF